MLKVPPLPPSNLNNCSIIDLDYDLKVKAKSSKWHRDLQTTTPIILGTIPLISYQPPVVPAGEKPPGEVNGENPNVPAGTGISPAGYNVPPPAMEVLQAPGNTGWNMPPSDPNAESQPNVPSQGPSLYPDLSPPTFSESMFGPKNIKDAGDNQYTQGNLEYAPRYPVFNFENK
ncbi:hypothetical protein B7P43_G07981 [Cryptotermes secundus]|nr:hypothetical protein B7P43_G07981 [Cryptotermes secundus]